MIVLQLCNAVGYGTVHDSQARLMHIIAFIGQKGASCKTTVAAALATAAKDVCEKLFALNLMR
jgi:hypothetical protein